MSEFKDQLNNAHFNFITEVKFENEEKSMFVKSTQAASGDTRKSSDMVWSDPE